ncbi:MAG TPA: 5'-nucleotidase, lipoprotein e(P4) family [Pyrinomonadaceae bacterium]|nr:5'-nucleotidase, lipoprotein e(P4) family [Pyrinomonadaceae bacterium]
MTAKNYLIGPALILSAFLGTSASAQQPAPAAQTNLDYLTSGVLYTQKAAEYRALAYQAFNIARERLDADFDKKNLKKLPKPAQKLPRAIVVDIDETVLDNSPSNAKQINTNTPFNTKDWYAWGEMRKAKAVPGAVDFLNYAVSKGVKIFYISNRDEAQRQATLDNLKSVGFNDVSSDRVMLRINGESPKGPRRDVVSSTYRIVMLLGDNLDDFASVFEKKSIAERFAQADGLRDRWGKSFIVLPNAMYGTWESAIYEHQRLTEAQKAERRAAALELP